MCIDRQFVLLSLSLAFVFGGVALYVGSAAAFVMNILGQSETAFAWLFVPMIGGMVIWPGPGQPPGPPSGARTPDGGGLWRHGGRRGGELCLRRCGWFVPYAVMPIFAYTFGLALAMPGLSVQALACFPA